VTLEKSRGRLEIPHLWVVAAGELGQYVAQDCGWQPVMQLGWLRRWRKGRPQQQWRVEELRVLTSRRATTPPRQFLALVRQHATIENRVQWRRAISFPEDRLPGRQIGVA